MSKKDVQVQFTYLDSSEHEFHIVARIIAGMKAPAQGFDRFQEPDDPDTVEIVSITGLNGEIIDQSAFTDAEIEEIENQAFEQDAEDFDVVVVAIHTNIVSSIEQQLNRKIRNNGKAH